MGGLKRAYFREEFMDKEAKYYDPRFVGSVCEKYAAFMAETRKLGRSSSLELELTLTDIHRINHRSLDPESVKNRLPYFEDMYVKQILERVTSNQDAPPPV